MQFLPRLLKFLYYLTIVGAFCANMIVVSHTTALSVLGAGLALRGPDGSMVTATDGLYEERKAVFLVFGYGLACTVGSVVICVWLILHWEAALVCMAVTVYTSYKIYHNYRRVIRRFQFDESETVDFTDIFEGPASIRVIPKAIRRTIRRMSRNKKQKDRADHDDDDHDNDNEDEEMMQGMVLNGGILSTVSSRSRR